MVDDAGDVVTEARRAGNDTVEASLDWTLGADQEALVLTGGATHGTGNALANAIAAFGGPAWLEGAGGKDTLTGTAGADTLDGGTGADRMAGGAGDDLYLVDDAGDQVQERGGAGTDTVLASVSVVLANDVEVLRLVGAAIAGTGNKSANLIEGNDLDNLLSGAGGADTLLGGMGADTLAGGTGADQLTGGEGADAFLFGSVADRGDAIADFAPGDIILVSAAGFGGGLHAGADAMAEHLFVAGLRATDTHGQFEWDAAHGRLYWDADGSGLGGRTLLATLQPGAVLTAADIHVVA